MKTFPVRDRRNDESTVVELIEVATSAWTGEETGHGDPNRHLQERIAAALGAIALLLMRQDEEVVREWRGF